MSHSINHALLLYHSHRLFAAYAGAALHAVFTPARTETLASALQGSIALARHFGQQTRDRSATQTFPFRISFETSMLRVVL